MTGTWAMGIAGADSEIAALLYGVPGPMCPKIDAAIGAPRSGWSRRRYRENLPKKATCPDAEDYDDLYAVAEAIEEDRERMADGLEECRTALDALRSALERVVDHALELLARLDQAEVSP